MQLARHPVMQIEVVTKVDGPLGVVRGGDLDDLETLDAEIDDEFDDDPVQALDGALELDGDDDFDGHVGRGAGREHFGPGDILVGRYRIQLRIGCGGMGSVFRARDQLLGRDVAVKTIAMSCLCDEVAVARLQREGRILAALDSPHLPPIYDLGCEGDHMFLVMRYISAPPMSDCIIEERSMPHRRVARIACHVLEALGHMHAQGFVHRDVKPSNILVDRHDHATLVDLGIVFDPEAEALTSQGYVVGTPAYMSPEQKRGDELDGRSDIYSLGLTLMHALTGQSPARFYSSQTNLSRRAAALPGPWRGIIGRAIHPDREDRFATAEAMAQAIVESSW